MPTIGVHFIISSNNVWQFTHARLNALARLPEGKSIFIFRPCTLEVHSFQKDYYTVNASVSLEQSFPLPRGNGVFICGCGRLYDDAFGMINVRGAQVLDLQATSWRSAPPSANAQCLIWILRQSDGWDILIDKHHVRLIYLERATSFLSCSYTCQHCH